jgi:hypothetical protein
MANGTFSIRASVWASSVFPQPVGPSRMMLDFWSSTSPEAAAPTWMRL